MAQTAISQTCCHSEQMFLQFFYANLGMKTSFPPQRHRGDNALSQCLRTVMDVNIFEPFSVFIRWELVTAGREHLAGRQHGRNTSHDAAGLK